MNQRRDASDPAEVTDTLVRARCRELITLLTAGDITIAVAESFTAGLASYLLVDEPGAGEVVLGSAVVYHATEKRRILGVSDGPVVSARCAIEMSAGVRRLFNATSSLAWTGVAGPDTQEGQPVGTVFVSSRLGSHAQLQQHRYHGTPNQIRLQAILSGVTSLARMIDRGRLDGPAGTTTTYIRDHHPGGNGSTCHTTQHGPPEKPRRPHGTTRISET